MVVTVLRTTLRDALLVAERFLGKQLSLPIIGNILIKTDSQKLKIQATNLEMGVEVQIPAKIAREGSIAIPPRVLSSLLQTLPDEKITLEEKEGVITLETDSSQSEIRGIISKDFPIMPQIKGKTKVTIKNSILIPQLLRILPSISASDFKPGISGLFFRAGKKQLTLTGTDTFRLAEAKISEFAATEETSAIIPLRPLQEFVKIADPDQETTFLFHEGQVAIESENVKIVTRLIQDRYPDYENLIPKDFSTSLFIPRDEMLSSVKLSSVFSSKLNDVVLSYRPNHLMLEILNPDVGKHTKEINAKVSGKSGRIGFNYRYLSDALEGLRSSEISVSLIDETRPALIRDDQDPQFFTILMPIRIS
ncbi:MAG: DNA polymerase III subunit beta [Candidatus Sungbacteria bacterium]|uniref:Beta sliding clamp n=1 Tax=Candidatus Sungiibacteriota bacterium TaxID=2750080 RepID=A0A9D6LQV8_9BACT|nr:DNA polymerase III subunit beta [Candidatus Sungbacteria bacterium]